MMPVRHIALAAALVLVSVTGLPAPGSSGEEEPAVYLVGAARQSIDPDPDGTFAGEQIYLGGASFWREARGIIDPGIYARAFVISEDDDPANALVIATIETVGYFVSYKQGPYGIAHIRHEASARTGIPIDRIIVNSTHTHAGPDTIGVWSPAAPAAYLAHIDAQTVAAIEAAWADRQPAHIRYGTAPAGDLLSNDYPDDPANAEEDGELRALQAVNPDTGEGILTLANLSAHPIIHIAPNRVSPDWPGVAAEKLAERYGGEGFGLVGALGRMAPDRSPAWAACGTDAICRLHHYSQAVADRASAALDAGGILTGAPVVDGRSYLLLDPVTNPAVLALVYGGEVLNPATDALTASRSMLPPWMTGNLLATVTFSARIGNLIFSGGPGELFPSIPAEVRDRVPADAHFIVGLAGDMLGYIVYPQEAYPYTIWRGAVYPRDPDDPQTWGVPGDDKYLFNVSHTIGDRIACLLLRGAGEVMGQGLTYWKTLPQCRAFAADLAFESGRDADPFGIGP